MSSRVVKRSYRYRFYPTDDQAEQLNRTFGCVRYVYNRALAERSRAWTQDQRRVTYVDTAKMLTSWKKEPDTVWLSDVSSVPLQQALRHLQSAKTCSACGAIIEKLPLNIREWACRCGVTHDRDVNAAKNILAAGLAVAACGDGVRPPRARREEASVGETGTLPG